jgi:uncharacterized membrane protein
MCFSASVSFGSGVALGALGVASMKNVQTQSQIPFAAIPFLFAIQQFAKGYVWLSFTQKAYEGWGTSASYLFLIFAQVVWPVFVPFSIWLIEKNDNKKKQLLYLTVVGFILSCFFAYSLVAYNVKTEINTYHVSYTMALPFNRMWLDSIYVIVSVLPLFITSHQKIYILGIAIVLSLLISMFFYSGYIISVWCFFAAINSGIILYLIKEMNSTKLSRKMVFTEG